MTNDMHEAGYGHKTFVYVGAPLPILNHFNHKDVNLNILQPATLQCPSNISDICGWFGLVNQVAPFFASRPVMQPFRELLIG